MGFGGIGIWQLLIIFAIIVLIFGTKKLRNIGTDLGGAIKGFKKAVTDENKEATENSSGNITKKEDANFESANATSEQKEKDKV